MRRGRPSRKKGYATEKEPKTTLTAVIVDWENISNLTLTSVNVVFLLEVLMILS